MSRSSSGLRRSWAGTAALARKQAEQKGLPYQTYSKSLLHETLTEREKQKAGW